jgi:hypothetical protein
MHALTRARGGKNVQQARPAAASYVAANFQDPLFHSIGHNWVHFIVSLRPPILTPARGEFEDVCTAAAFPNLTPPRQGRGR